MRHDLGRSAFALVLIVLFSFTVVAASDRDSSKNALTFSLIESALDGNERAVEAALYSIAASACFIPRLSLPNVSVVNNPESLFIPSAIVLDHSDVSKYLASLERGGGAFSSFIARVVGRLNPVARSAVALLREVDLKEGELIITGEVSLEGGESVDSMTILKGENYEDIDIIAEFDIELSGSLFSVPLRISGIIEAKGGSENSLIISSDKLILNGKEYIISPHTIKIEMR